MRLRRGRAHCPAPTTPQGLRIADAAATSDWLERPTLITGGGVIVSTARDFYRYGAMLLGEGALDNVRVMKPETARLAFSKLAPTGLAAPSGRTGEGSRAVLAPLAPAGTFSAAGAAGTVFWKEHSIALRRIGWAQDVQVRREMDAAIDAARRTREIDDAGVVRLSGVERIFDAACEFFIRPSGAEGVAFCDRGSRGNRDARDLCKRRERWDQETRNRQE